MTTQQLKNYLRILFKQGRFTGDLNPVQQYCLSWALVDEREDAADLEQERMKYTILANNPDLYKAVYEPDQRLALTEEEWTSMEEAEMPVELETALAEYDQFLAQRENFTDEL